MNYYILKIRCIATYPGEGYKEVVLTNKKKLSNLIRKISLSDDYDVAGVQVIENGWSEQDVLAELKGEKDLVLGNK